MRATLPSFLFFNYRNGTAKVDLQPYSAIFDKFLYRVFNLGMADDYPHINKSVSLMIFDLIDKFKQLIVGVGD